MSFNAKYYPQRFHKGFTKERTCTVQPTFEIDEETPVYESVQKDISALKAKQFQQYQSSIIQYSPGPVTNIFATPTKPLITPSTPKIRMEMNQPVLKPLKRKRSTRSYFTKSSFHPRIPIQQQIKTKYFWAICP